MKIKAVFAITAFIITTGCASQPSTYKDTSTPEQRNIEATGQAATEAARSNTSNNADAKIDVQRTDNSPMTISAAPTSSYRVEEYPSNTGPGVEYRVYRDGRRDFDMEFELRRQAMINKAAARNGRSGYVGQYLDETKRQFDRNMDRKISKSVRNLMEKIF